MSTTGYAYAFLSTLTIGFLSSALVLPAIAQVTSDGTTNTIVNPNGNNYTIINGIEKGNNLFHSFSNFSVPTGGSASFDLINTPNITTIFSRVTGGNISNIDGLIQILNSNNPVSLFLMNPAGIVFGQNASLNIGGSFVGTTANSIKFADGTEFSTNNPGAPPLLTISVPIGLQMGTNPGAIQVQGAGHTGQFSDSLQVSGLNLGTTGLQVQPGNTLALVGGNIALDGGLLSAPGGRIELGSVTSGTVALNSNPQRFALSYANASGFGNIDLTQRALASTQDLTKSSGGSIQLQGKQVSLRDGSLVLIQNRSNQAAGDITVNATESLQIIGKSPNFTASSALVNETVARGAGGNIVISAPQFLIDQGGFVLSRTYSSAPAGNIVVNASQMVVNGFAANDSDGFRSGSLLLASSNGSGKGGNVDITTHNLSILSGSRVSASPISSGVGGDVTVTADSIQIDGGTRTTNTSLSTTASGTANAGDLTLNTRTLSVQSGGVVSVSSFRSGNSGSLTVNASESIEVNGTRQTLIGASVLAFFNPNTLANAGRITLNTPVLTVRKAGIVLIDNRGLGNAGSLTVNAERLQLDAGGSILASTRSGNGGNINLQLQKLLILRHGSNITTTAGGNGNAGNILINSPIILGLENSDIIANAFQGKGGNINITTQGLFGLKYRDRLTSENDITASSQFGLNGNVQITSPDVDPNSGLVELPANVTDPSQQIATGCASNQGSQFVATGRGGIPPNPLQQVGSDVYDGLRLRTWDDVRDISAYRKTGDVTAQIPPSSEVLVQATSWRRNADGKVELIADKSATQVQQPLTCAAVTKI
ncbi:two-partner secretion domain-containing protein [Nostoc sp.]|uniref:two-partner secretion domain-containing protein n=1 Tax=Nostoc sp. TaxID=1180 RepID=UPI003FA55B24